MCARVSPPCRRRGTEMFGATKVGKQRPLPYATTTDFCQIFETDMKRLYRLSFLLTGDEPTAEQCFLGGLQMAKEGNPVFKNWAEAWARRMIILDAIRVLHPQLIVDTSESFGRGAGGCATDRTSNHRDCEASGLRAIRICNVSPRRLLGSRVFSSYRLHARGGCCCASSCSRTNRKGSGTSRRACKHRPSSDQEFRHEE
jgi:hypothetical protein